MTQPTDPPVPRLLLTGFEPFGVFAANPSWELARRFDSQTLDMAHITTAQLPVDWARAWPVLQAAIAREQPTWLLMLGVAASRQVASAEIRGRNFTNPLRDNANGLPPPDDRIEPDGPAYRISTIAAPLVTERLMEGGVPAEVSTDAGGYLCNWVLYQALGYAETHPALRGVGFLHLPPLPEGGAAARILDGWERGLRLVIESLVAGAAPLSGVVEAEIAAERRPGHA